MFIDNKTSLWIYGFLIVFILIFIYMAHVEDEKIVASLCDISKSIKEIQKEEINKVLPRTLADKEQDLKKLKTDLDELTRRKSKSKALLNAVVEGIIRGCIMGLIIGNGKIEIIGKSAATWAILPIIIYGFTGEVKKLI